MCGGGGVRPGGEQVGKCGSGIGKVESRLLQVSLDPKAETDLGVGLFVGRKEEEEALAVAVTVEDVLDPQGPYKRCPGSGCYRKLSQTGQLINSRHLFSQSRRLEV